MGVRRAVEIAYREAASSGRVYTIGPLIHNPQVLEDLRRRGVQALSEEDLPPDLSGATVLIRAHGITPQLEGELERRGARLVDATCPKVKASQMKARQLSEAGYRIFLAGERRHGELIGIQGYAPDCLVAANPQEAADCARRTGAQEVPTALIAQTTISTEEYTAIADAVRALLPQTEVIDTICPATRDRQDALRELSGQVEALIVAGGRLSANTRRLLAIAQSSGKPAWLVEGPEEIPPEALKFSVLGLSAGASTPDSVIDAIEDALAPRN
jgi:4-hydroxy-3-methylbut-2-enyl diphosphate reductase